MKVNQYAVIPSAVRYDAGLSDKAMLLYAEITAASNTYGICEEDNGYFASALRVDSRTVTRCLAQLTGGGHIARVIEGNRRKLKIIHKTLDLPVELVEPDKIETNLVEFTIQLLTLWEQLLDCKIDRKEMYAPMVKLRLIKFNHEELLSSLKSRAHYVTKTSDWHRDPENRQHQVNVDVLLKDDETVLKYLNMKLEEQPKLKAFGL